MSVAGRRRDSLRLSMVGSPGGYLALFVFRFKLSLARCFSLHLIPPNFVTDISVQRGEFFSPGESTSTSTLTMTLTMTMWIVNVLDRSLGCRSCLRGPLPLPLQHESQYLWVSSRGYQKSSDHFVQSQQENLETSGGFDSLQPPVHPTTFLLLIIILFCQTLQIEVGCRFIPVFVW